MAFMHPILLITVFGFPVFPFLVGNGLEAVGTADWLSGLINDGIVAGVGAGSRFCAADARSIPAPCFPGSLRIYGPYRFCT